MHAPAEAGRTWLQDFPSLILRSQQYTHTNGAQVPLLMAEGTIPMYYQVCVPLLSELQSYAEVSQRCQGH